MASACLSRYFYLFKLSYLYTVVIGFFVTFVVGFVVSILLKALNITKSDKTDDNFDLFFPPIAKRLRKQQNLKENLLLNSNNNGEISVAMKENQSLPA
jgi:solute carrier family 5 (sodium-coupled monocarboxylate transporter), member 8/12